MASFPKELQVDIHMFQKTNYRLQRINWNCTKNDHKQV